MIDWRGQVSEQGQASGRLVTDKQVGGVFRGSMIWKSTGTSASALFGTGRANPLRDTSATWSLLLDTEGRKPLIMW